MPVDIMRLLHQCDTLTRRSSFRAIFTWL